MTHISHFFHFLSTESEGTGYSKVSARKRDDDGALHVFPCPSGQGTVEKYFQQAMSCGQCSLPCPLGGQGTVERKKETPNSAHVNAANTKPHLSTGGVSCFLATHTVALSVGLWVYASATPSTGASCEATLADPDGPRSRPTFASSAHPLAMRAGLTGGTRDSHFSGGL